MANSAQRLIRLIWLMFFIKANELDVTIYLLVEINGLDRCNFVISRLYACLNLLSRLNRKERAFGVMV